MSPPVYSPRLHISLPFVAVLVPEFRRKTMPKLSKQRVEALEPREKDYVVFDSDVTGFAVRVLPSGKKTYMIQYRAHGRQRKVAIGKHGTITVDQARTKARELFGRIARGDDPAQEIATYRKAPDVRTLGERFMKEHVHLRCKPTTQREYQRALDLYINPAFGNRKISDITRPDVAELHHKYRDRPYQANRTLGVISKMFNLAELWGLRADGSNPCRHVPKYKEQKRERFLSGEELSRLFVTLDELQTSGEESVAACNAFRLLCLTGCRLSEIQKLKWEYIRPPYILLPDSKTGPRRLPLSPELDALLKSIERMPGNPYVITGLVPGQHLTDLQRPWRRIRKKAELEGVRIHDLRHTYASNAVMSGLSLEEIAKLLGHTQIQTTARYAHLSDEHVHAAAQQVSQHIAAQLNIPVARSAQGGGVVVKLSEFRKSD